MARKISFNQRAGEGRGESENRVEERRVKSGVARSPQKRPHERKSEYGGGWWGVVSADVVRGEVNCRLLIYA